MKKLITYFIKYPISGNVILFLLLLFGIMGLSTLRKTFFPENESKLILVEATYPGASPEEVEKSIVLKIEDQLDGITGIDRITSTSKENMGVVKVEVAQKFKAETILQDVKNAIDRINSFPEAMEPPSVYIKDNLSFAISFALSGNVDLKTLKLKAKDVETDLRAIDGISQIAISGYPDEEIEISLRERDLRAYQLTFDQVQLAVKKANIDLTGGTIKSSKEDLLIRSNNKVYTAEELENIVVAENNGHIVYLKDIATVIQKWSDNPNKKYYDEKNGVVLTLSNTIHEDIGDIVDATLEYIEQFNAENEVIKANVIRDGSIVLNERIDMLISNGQIGIILVLLFLSLFLNPRLAFWVALGIPVSFAGMFIAAAFYGISLNVISLFGMIIVIGILVDDGIVISENIYQHFERGKEPIQAAVDGTMEVLPSVFSAIMTTVVAFSIFFLLDGRMGEFFPEMGFVVIFTLLFSLVEGIFILPAHIAHSKAMNRDVEKKNNAYQKVLDWFTKVMDYMKTKWYGPVLDFAIKSPGIVLFASIALMAVTVTGMKTGAIRMTVFPNIENDFININLKLQAGTSEDITTKHINYIEQKAIEVLDSVSMAHLGHTDLTIGVEKTIGPNASNIASLNFILLPGEERKSSGMKLSNVIRDLKNAIGEIPNAEQLSFDVPTPFGKAIAIGLYSSNQNELEKAKVFLVDQMNALGSMKNIVSSDQKGLQEVNLSLKPEAYQLGLTNLDVMSEIRKGFFGIEAQRIQQGTDEVKIWLRYAEEDRHSIANLEEMTLRVKGKNYYIKDLVDINVERGLIAIEHIDGKRSILVQADLLNPDIDSPVGVNSIIENTIIPQIQSDYPSIKYSVEGQIREQAKTGRSAKLVVPGVLILMLTIIVLAFRSFSQTIAVVALIPFSFIGIGWGHWFHSAQISMFSYFGIIALIGVMVNDSLVFVGAFNANLKKGQPYKEALKDAGLSRFRPIVLTSLTTIAGLAPLIMEKSMQAQFLIPMAIAIAYGLAIATLLTLLLLPSYLVLFNQLKRGVKWLITGKKVSEESVEPAVKEIPYEQLKID